MSIRLKIMTFLLRREHTHFATAIIEHYIENACHIRGSKDHHEV